AGFFRHDMLPSWGCRLRGTTGPSPEGWEGLLGFWPRRWPRSACGLLKAAIRGSSCRNPSRKAAGTASRIRSLNAAGIGGPFPCRWNKTSSPFRQSRPMMGSPGVRARWGRCSRSAVGDLPPVLLAEVLLVLGQKDKLLEAAEEVREKGAPLFAAGNRTGGA